MCSRSAEYANKPHNTAKAWTFLQNATFHTTPHDAALVPRDAAFVTQLLWQIPH
jgi:hypothetical protein